MNEMREEKKNQTHKKKGKGKRDKIRMECT
jgi:hypothetical protein